jgi:hypothetical protein
MWHLDHGHDPDIPVTPRTSGAADMRVGNVDEIFPRGISIRVVIERVGTWPDHTERHAWTREAVAAAIHSVEGVYAISVTHKFSPLG